MRKNMTKLTKSKPGCWITNLAKSQRPLLCGLMERVVWRAIGDLKPIPG
jgi:hypothetical protein